MKTLWFVGLISLLLAACSSTPNPTLAPTKVVLASPTATATPRPTQTATRTPTQTRTPTPQPRGLFPSSKSIAVSLTPHTNCNRILWSDNSDSLAIANETNTGQFQWFLYQLGDGVVGITNPPKRYDDSIFHTLNIERPVRLINLTNPVSPSGSKVIYEISSEPKQLTEIWIGNIENKIKAKVLSRNYFFGISQISWSEDENSALLTVGSVGPADFILIDTANATFTELYLSTDGPWSLSPDGQLLAYTPSLESSFKLFDIASETEIVVDSFGWWPQWSRDGQHLYYWWGENVEQLFEMRMYDLTNHKISTLFDRRELGRDYPEAYSFSFSPDGNFVGICYGRLWIVSLRK